MADQAGLMKKIVFSVLLAGLLSGCVYSAEPGYGYNSAVLAPAPVYVAPPPPPIMYGPSTTVVIGVGGGWHHHHHYWGPPPPGRWGGRPPFPP